MCVEITIQAVKSSSGFLWKGSTAEAVQSTIERRQGGMGKQKRQARDELKGDRLLFTVQTTNTRCNRSDTSSTSLQ